MYVVKTVVCARNNKNTIRNNIRVLLSVITTTSPYYNTMKAYVKGGRGSYRAEMLFYSMHRHIYFLTFYLPEGIKSISIFNL